MTGAKTTPPLATAPDKSSIEHLSEAGILGINISIWQLVVLAASWIGIGLLTALALKKRGHEFGPNAALGVILGPLFVFLAFDMVRHRERDELINLSTSPATPGPVALVVITGDIGNLQAVSRTIQSIAETNSIIASVPVEYEVAERVHGMGKPPPSSQLLDEITQALGGDSAGQMMLPGPIGTSIPLAVEETNAEIVLLIGSESSSAAPDLEELVDVPVMRVAPESSPSPE